jgi:hypothetical protein
MSWEVLDEKVYFHGGADPATTIMEPRAPPHGSLTHMYVDYTAPCNHWARSKFRHSQEKNKIFTLIFFFILGATIGRLLL